MTAPAITEFRGEYEFLRNPYPCLVTVDGMPFPSAEHAYQALKWPGDVAQQEHLLGLPWQVAKRMSRDRRLSIDQRLTNMRRVVAAKFENKVLQQWLRDTGDVDLVEGNEHRDSFWGKVRAPGGWYGANHLGLILMAERTAQRDWAARVGAP